MIRKTARILCIVLVASCGGALPVPEGPPPLGESDIVAAGASTFDPHARLPLFHSKRFELNLPLPDGRAWRINDHSLPALVATHEASHSKLALQRFTIDELANRQKCEKAALALHVIPTAPLVAVEDVNEMTQESYDTHVVVGIEPNEAGQPLVGHVIAAGGSIHKCYAFDFRSEVASSAEAERLSDRLAFARARILGGMRIEKFAEPPIPRAKLTPSSGPESRPGP